MNKKIADQLLKVASAKFDESWAKEKSRLEELWKQYCKEVLHLKPKTGLAGIHHPYYGAKNEFYRKLFGSKPSELRASKYAAYQDLDSFFYNCGISGVTRTIGKRRQDYIDYLTKAMLKAIDKHVNFCFTEARDTVLTDSPKGFELTTTLWSETKTSTMVTTCISAGGYNIQRFHYRYITKIS